MAQDEGVFSSFLKDMRSIITGEDRSAPPAAQGEVVKAVNKNTEELKKQRQKKANIQVRTGDGNVTNKTVGY
jgi:spore germination protein YaaH